MRDDLLHSAGTEEQVRSHDERKLNLRKISIFVQSFVVELDLEMRSRVEVEEYCFNFYLTRKILETCFWFVLKGCRICSG